MTICICGAGTMGSGIALVSATSGFPTILYDLNAEMVHQAAARIEADLERMVQKQKTTPEKKAAAIGRIRFTTDLQHCVADVVIEAIVEKIEVKASLFQALAAINSPQTIFATNTSSLSVAALAAQVPGPGRVAGLHFFNPAPVMKLVEVVRTALTSAEVAERLITLTKAMGKEPVVCKDAPGFIVNRVARPYYIESLRLAEEGKADFATIDRLLESKGFRMGPFRLMDLIGNDVNYAVSCSVYEQLQRPERLRPSPIQKEKLDAGALGKKTGEGYYRYP